MKALAILIALGLTCPAAAGDTLRPQDKIWLKQVEFLITRDEQRAFEQTAASLREQFIEDFWSRRNPDPNAPVNAAREDHRRRIEYANANFREGSTPEWETPRGRTLLRWGPPDRRESLMAPPSQLRAERGAMLTRMTKLMFDVWYYSRPPAARAGLVRRIIFEPDVELNRYRAIADEQLPPTAASRWP